MFLPANPPNTFILLVLRKKRRPFPKLAFFPFVSHILLFIIINCIIKEILRRASPLPHLSGCPCHAIGVWSQRSLPPQRISIVTYIISICVPFVKNPLIAYIAFPTRLANPPSRYDRILVAWLIIGRMQAQNQLYPFAVFFNHFQYESCMGLILQNVVLVNKYSF